MNAVNFATVAVLICSSVQSSWSYRFYSLDNPSVCSPISKKTIKLERDELSAIVLTYKHINFHSVHWTSDFLCKFKIKFESYPFMHRKVGIFAVIQKLELRKNAASGECIDYVQFKRHNGDASQRFCGLIDRHIEPDSSLESDSDINDNSFDDFTAELDVVVFIGKEALYGGEQTILNITFTSYSACGKAPENYRACGDDHETVCIYKGFLNDGYVNCPYIDCPDEDGCVSPVVPTYPKESIGNKVLIGSVASLVLTMSIFICCLYICRKYGKLCWSEDFVRPSNADSSQNATRVIQLTTEESSGENQASSPTAPPPEEKDLPPSYDSLFPSR